MSLEITPVGVAKSALVIAAWYFYGFGAALIAFLVWGKWSGKSEYWDAVLFGPKK